jgi:hypothetical protein
MIFLMCVLFKKHYACDSTLHDTFHKLINIVGNSCKENGTIASSVKSCECTYVYNRVLKLWNLWTEIACYGVLIYFT